MGSPCAVALKVLASFEPIEETICSSMCASMKGILAASIYCFISFIGANRGIWMSVAVVGSSTESRNKLKMAPFCVWHRDGLGNCRQPSYT